jgi:hypothetical protein
MSLSSWSLGMNQQNFPFLTTSQSIMWSSTTPHHEHIFFKQFIGQQMVLQDSTSKCLHHLTFFNMLSNRIFEAQHAQILSCSSPRAGTSLISFLFARQQLKLSHLSIVGLPQCVCAHLIILMGINFLCYTHGNKHIGTMMQFTTLLPPLHNMLFSTLDENNYMCFP